MHLHTHMRVEIFRWCMHIDVVTLTVSTITSTCQCLHTPYTHYLKAGFYSNQATPTSPSSFQSLQAMLFDTWDIIQTLVTYYTIIIQHIIYAILYKGMSYPYHIQVHSYISFYIWYKSCSKTNNYSYIQILHIHISLHRYVYRKIEHYFHWLIWYSKYSKG